MGTLAKRHTNREYEAELSTVRQNLLLMAGRVEAMIDSAVRAFTEQNDGLARETVGRDAEVNGLELDIDELCLLILAKRQPVAGDLRFISLALKMVTDLERIGDLAVDICERTIALRGTERMASYSDIERMGLVARAMVRDAMDAFVSDDGAKARAVMETDQKLDRAYIDICTNVLEVMVGDKSKVERGIHIQSVAKFLERIGDHATNVAELVVFKVEGKDLRHAGKIPPGR